jgi:aspartyl/asparaginyl beta-hydroxylase (cupin superfamily)
MAEADRAAAGGDFGTARTLLRKAAETGEAGPDGWLRLAAVCRAQGDGDAALAAAEEALKLDPLHFLALLLRANLLERAGAAEAGEVYGHALAQRPDGDLPAQVASMVAHAEERYQAYQNDRDRALAEAVDRAGLDLTAAEVARLQRFRTNATRLTSVYHAEPADYHYPGLTEREFHERDRFDWLERLEAATDAIEAEFNAVAAAEHAELVPYIQYPQGVPLRQWAELNQNRDWTAIHLLRSGEIVEGNAVHCPRTMALLETFPMPDIPGVGPNAMFSLLAPGAHIPPHNGIANTRLVCHLPLIVPDGCWFRVGAERREWRRGEAWIFDDTIEHEAANEAEALRVILIIDVWHPDLNERERAGVRALIAAREGRNEGDGGRAFG